MTPKNFRVYFKTGRVCIVSCFDKKQAQILAQAQEIKNGNDYAVKSVTKL